MNIFILDHNFKLNAQYHVDSHVVKMPTEAAQMLCTAYRLLHGEKTDVYEVALDGTLIYKKDFYVVESDTIKLRKGKLLLLNKKIMAVSHINHPCSKWVRESKENFIWLRNYAFALNNEWRYRYGHTKNHLSINRILQTPLPDLPDLSLTKFVQAMPDEYKNEDPVIAYRTYYQKTKSHLFKYKKRALPEWLLNS